MLAQSQPRPELLALGPQPKARYRLQPLFVGIAAGPGIQGICHIAQPSTCARLAAFGLSV
ncbi:hypothetical protein [Hymenobacter siberiensis]|uniref:hypothetical protein n=1 Tax=Hymenobacter siberiensis TaxID=2848396 RepID=UPI001C1E3141|nr:hypothetical protein [Hymenobacter siberiensis]MBU6120674.1 hypothetical protein [Hymenobacter siberiensis]